MCEDLISIIIPTFERKTGETPDLLLNRALKSIYSQTYNNIEIIVIIDGKSELLENLLRNEQKKCLNLNFYSYGEKVGAATTRNFGVKKAKGEWIAFLDDDDEWLPNKLTDQMNYMKKNDAGICFSSIEFNGKKIPRKKYNQKKDISEFLMNRKFGRHIGIVQTSTIMVHREIVCEIPFTYGLKKHQDWDWIIRTAKNYPVHHYDKVLSIYNTDVQMRMSKNSSWRYSLNWINQSGDYVTRKAYCFFVLETILKGIKEDNSLNFLNKRKKMIQFFFYLKSIHKYSLSGLYLFFKSLF